MKFRQPDELGASRYMDRTRNFCSIPCSSSRHRRENVEEPRHSNPHHMDIGCKCRNMDMDMLAYHMHGLPLYLKIRL